MEWLCAGDPAVRALCRRDVLGAVVPAGAALTGPLVTGLLEGILEPAASSRPYAKWTGAHWRLVSLVELGLPPGHPEGVTAGERLLGHWAEPRRLAAVPVVAGRARRCASQEGNAVAVACRLGLGDDPRVATLAERLVAWQWPDGGWNCDPRPEATHSSFHETLPALWGLHEFAAATGDRAAGAAVGPAAELLLRHELLWSRGTGRLIHPSFGLPHYPPYWHYDVLQALLVLHRAGFGDDPRTDRARALLTGRRRADGTWRAARRWWRPPTGQGWGGEAVDWGEDADRMVTLNALRVGAGR
ncbi:hypothetical protein [Blastococcus tunisiensis]|uniref:Prenyltransferase and squalene oxidase repeat-containing protein n=1 Tax=Blastococcus tunisiensis TaxID=1798228 RepID=A0A1I2E246_9ACTN|nr:hypothetical protein [Blastococcus sp. DSM 46838]SFE86915.1 hypothetical protein SAMN05216574_106214 [Blastococcus sp. DSM 46838]